MVLNSQDSKVNEHVDTSLYQILLDFCCDLSRSSFVFGPPVVKILEVKLFLVLERKCGLINSKPVSDNIT